MKEIKEVWKTAVYIFESGVTIEFPGYKVSDQGRVKSLNYRRTGKERVLRPGSSKCNDDTIMYKVLLCKGNKRYTLPVHRIVMSSFDADNWKPGYTVNHKTERTTTSCVNELSNLEWISQKENVNTEHCKALQHKAQTNRKDLSKRVKVTDLSTGKTVVYLSTQEVQRVLGIKSGIVSRYIRDYNGFYKKGNLHFSYI